VKLAADDVPFIVQMTHNYLGNPAPAGFGALPRLPLYL